MTVIEQNRSFIERWNSLKVVPTMEVKVLKYEEVPIILDDLEKMKLVEVGDKISSPTGLSSFVVSRISGHELVTIRNGKTGLRTFKEIIPSCPRYRYGYYSLYKEIKV